MAEGTDFERWCDIIAKTPGHRREPEDAPKDGSTCRFQVLLELGAFWCDDAKRWVLTRPLNLEYLPTRAERMAPKIPEPDTPVLSRSNGTPS